jgi:hypothetical protein
MECAMAEYPGELLPFPPYLLSSLPHLHERVILDPSKPSGVRVLGRSMFMVAAGWLVAIAWLWAAALQVPGPLHLALGSIAPALAPALLMALVGYAFRRRLGRAPYSELEWREWRHAFGWSIVPNALLLSTAWVIISNAQL